MHFSDQQKKKKKTIKSLCNQNICSRRNMPTDFGIQKFVQDKTRSTFFQSTKRHRGQNMTMHTFVIKKKKCWVQNMILHCFMTNHVKDTMSWLNKNCHPPPPPQKKHNPWILLATKTRWRQRRHLLSSTVRRTKNDDANGWRQNGPRSASMLTNVEDKARRVLLPWLKTLRPKLREFLTFVAREQRHTVRCGDQNNFGEDNKMRRHRFTRSPALPWDPKKRTWCWSRELYTHMHAHTQKKIQTVNILPWKSIFLLKFLFWVVSPTWIFRMIKRMYKWSKQEMQF